jgi:hypothetical protein
LRNWRKKSELDLERELRHNRPTPTPELYSVIESRVHARQPGSRARTRGVIAIAITVAMLAALLPVGALGYASSAIKQVAATAASIASVQASTPTARNSAAQAQYPKPAKKKCPKGTKRKGKKCVKVKKKAKGARVSRRGPRFTG